jgi:CHAT domain-containing protein
MKRLFEANGASQGDALRQAEVALMDSSEFSHPFYWAGFTLIGDGSRGMPVHRGP